MEKAHHCHLPKRSSTYHCQKVNFMDCNILQVRLCRLKLNEKGKKLQNYGSVENQNILSILDVNITMDINN